jgi:acetylornithine/succinyldiaminopimelate/putrescine aminotransferase
MHKYSTDNKIFFHDHLAQTTAFPLGIEIEKAEGIYIYDKNGIRYTDMISGISVNNIGHCHPHVINSIKNQLGKHMHVMAYGEFIQDAQSRLGQKLSEILPDKLNNAYLVNSGTEANEGAIKLAKRYTGKTEIISCYNSYHGSSIGSLSITGNEQKIEFNHLEELVKMGFLRKNTVNSETFYELI